LTKLTDQGGKGIILVVLGGSKGGGGLKIGESSLFEVERRCKSRRPQRKRQIGANSKSNLKPCRPIINEATRSKQPTGRGGKEIRLFRGVSFTPSERRGKKRLL